jgi:hypothetical protein
MVLRRDALRPQHRRLVADQRHDVARTGTFDGFMKTGQRADVDHRIRFSVFVVI